MAAGMCGRLVVGVEVEVGVDVAVDVAVELGVKVGVDRYRFTIALARACCDRAGRGAGPTLGKG